MLKYSVLVPGIIALLCRLSFAQINNTPDSSSFVPNIKPVLNISRCPDNSINIDGIINEAAWVSAVKAENFAEIEPGDNIKPPVETEVLIAYDDNNLYFGFICYDDDMKNLICNYSDRDKMFTDDWVGPIIDPYGDNRKAYEIFSNAFGIQGDLIWTKQGENSSYDLIFTSEAKIYKDKWTVEMAIPFKSLSFPNKDNHEWKIHFIRTRPRETRTQMSWAAISRDDPAFIAQAGILKGIKNVKGGKNLEILPYVIGGFSGYKQDLGDPDSKFVSDSVVKGEFGVGIKYGFTSNLTGEVVYNPDFSQVESDAAKVDINSSSALFYSEKRPFFLEGSDIFNSYVDVVYTRMINDPLVAVKLTGNINGIDLGYVGAYDEKTQFILPFDYGSDFTVSNNLKSFSNILRLRKSLKGESFLGFIATDHEVKKGHNRVIGLDGSFNFLGDVYLNWEGLYYQNQEINDSGVYSSDIMFGKNREHTLTFDGETFNGFGGYVELQKKGRHYGGSISLNSTPPEARRDLGFISNNNFRTLNTSNWYTFYPEKSFFLRVEPQLGGGLRYDYNNRLREQWLVPGLWLLLKKQIDINANYLLINNEEFGGVYHKNVNRGWINMNVNGWQKAQGGFYFELGKYIVRFEDPSFVGYGFYLETWLDLRPIDRLVSSFSYIYNELSENAGGNKLFAGYIFRNKTSFQFNKNLFLRLILQYDSFDRRIEIDPLFSYKWNPFTIFYIGSTHEILNYNDGKSSGRFKETGRQFFAKFQYLFRL